MSDIEAQRDRAFVERLKRSRQSVEVVAQYLRLSGHNPIVRETKIRPTRAEWRKYSDDGDIHIGADRVEVKGRSIKFDGRFNYPFKDVIITDCGSFDRAKPTPILYFILNAALTSAAIIDVAKTRAHWWIESTYNKLHGREIGYYRCSSDVPIWKRMPKQIGPNDYPEQEPDPNDYDLNDGKNSYLIAFLAWASRCRDWKRNRP